MRIKTVRGHEYSNDKVQNAITAFVCNPIPDKTVIDACCGDARLMRYLPFKFQYHVDIFPHTISPMNRGVFIMADILQTDLRADCFVAFDAVEHFTEGRALDFIRYGLNHAEKSLHFTPLGDLWIIEGKDDDPLPHKTGWTPEKVEEAFPGVFDAVVFDKFHGAPINHGAWFFFTKQTDVQWKVLMDIILKLTGE